MLYHVPRTEHKKDCEGTTTTTTTTVGVGYKNSDRPLYPL